MQKKGYTHFVNRELFFKLKLKNFLKNENQKLSTQLIMMI